MMGKWRVKPWLGRNVSGSITSLGSHGTNRTTQSHTWTCESGILSTASCIPEHSFSQACNRLIQPIWTHETDSQNNLPIRPENRKENWRAWTNGSRVYTTGNSLKTDDIFSLEEMLQDSLNFLSSFFEQRKKDKKTVAQAT